MCESPTRVDLSLPAAPRAKHLVCLHLVKSAGALRLEVESISRFELCVFAPPPLIKPSGGGGGGGSKLSGLVLPLKVPPSSRPLSAAGSLARRALSHGTTAIAVLSTLLRG